MRVGKPIFPSLVGSILRLSARCGTTAGLSDLLRYWPAGVGADKIVFAATCPHEDAKNVFIEDPFQSQMS